MNADLRTAYDEAAQLWAEGPEPVYAALARALVAAAEARLAGGRLAGGRLAGGRLAGGRLAGGRLAGGRLAGGRLAGGRLAGGRLAGGRVLDLGAGTGVAGRAARAAGAGSVVSADPALGMLRRCGTRAHPVAADATALPFRDGSFDLVLAAFCLGHLSHPAAGLREARRVGAGLAASSFAPGWTHPAKAAVDEVLGAFGYQSPSWYITFKQDTEPRASDPAWLSEITAAVGFTDVRLATTTVDTGLSTPAQLASWRLGMAHVAPFVCSLTALRRAELWRAAQSAVAGTGPLVVSMLMLTAR